MECAISNFGAAADVLARAAQARFAAGKALPVDAQPKLPCDLIPAKHGG